MGILWDILTQMTAAKKEVPKPIAIDKVLVANRGEIALRIIRACKELGIKTVAVYSQADVNSMHVKMADESYCIGPATPQRSYLNIPAIVSAAEVSGAQAIHPGYGFLAENAHFAEVCESNGIKFIGPSPDNIRLMGDKNEARKTCRDLGIPLVPGSDGLVKSEDDLKKTAAEVGYPVMIKASAGGGGKGMRIVTDPKNVVEQYRIASSEAQIAFGNGDVYIEKFIEEPRHVEIQILSDKTGHAIHLGERDCSIQRRHQKLIEEAPSPVLDQKLREQMGQSAIDIAKGIKFEGAGTVEFLVDKNKNYYFMEMNTRIQVEHPVTEMITGVNLIAHQIDIARTGRLSLKQSDVSMYGHAIEFRINAEDPSKNFMPCPGKVGLFLPPGGFGVRIDTHVYPEYVIPPNYDSLLGKLIVWGMDRDDALRRAKRALDEFVVDGISTTIPFFMDIIDNDLFKNGTFDTGFVDQFLN